MSRHPETRRKWFQNGFNLFEEGPSGQPSDAENVVVEQLEVEPKETTLDDLRGALRRRVNHPSCFRGKVQETKYEQAYWQHKVFARCQKIRIIKFVNSQGLPGKREESVFGIHMNVVKLWRRIIQFLRKRVNLVCTIVKQSKCRIIFYWLQCCPAKSLTAQETKKQFEKYFAAARSETEYDPNFVRACEDFRWNHDKSISYRSETKGTAESAVRWVTEDTSAFLFSLSSRK